MGQFKIIVPITDHSPHHFRYMGIQYKAVLKTLSSFNVLAHLQRVNSVHTQSLSTHSNPKLPFHSIVKLKTISLCLKISLTLLVYLLRSLLPLASSMFALYIFLVSFPPSYFSTCLDPFKISQSIHSSKQFLFLHFSYTHKPLFLSRQPDLRIILILLIHPVDYFHFHLATHRNPLVLSPFTINFSLTDSYPLSFSPK